ncbi:KUP/HAK/KT family potassium transporter [Paraburkholderia sp. CNPSo 3076]|uniref:potassium transporter Kup n=1 Tax=Paraburkholderia sp. CNPSo 3076 TaxID=2940936 RepID=UPI00224F45BB|nr:KUP/HAK/KT family potassium transporter [Paraburkholderia sp. CNPSo 3076]MCX5541352.1 KUP/HAK/KT family potassium transporter [Paraburkholderia sp. CNPSo 3076]
MLQERLNPHENSPKEQARKQDDDSGQRALVLGALGVVFGDIGTSPIYALREAVQTADSTAQPVVMGVLSMILWAVLIVVVLKYACFVMRADNEGEGGIVALTALVRAGFAKAGRPAPRLLVLAGLVGAAMFYGDSMITPAISVLSAVEGLKEINPAFDSAVLPVSLAILVALFLFQPRGTAVVGRTFGPVMALWFLSLGAVGVYHIVLNPAILAATSPVWAVRLALAHPGLSFGVLAGVILALTGAEALYADIGHFGTRSIRIAFFCVVLPAIVVGYFGQAATVLFEPRGASQPFFRSVPHWALIPAVGIAMLATIIASQAVISGAFSMTSQAIELGFLPRMRTIETSSTRRGQVYVPAVNAGLLVAVVFLVLFFRNSERLTSAYGLAVAMTMVTTSMQMLSVCREVWGWPRVATWLACVPLLVVDGMLLAANLPKIPTGGWFPVSVGALLFITMSTWNRGRELEARHAARGESVDAFLRGICTADPKPLRVPGTAVYPGNAPGMTPAALASNVRHNHVRHRTVIVFANVSESAPQADDETRIEARDLGAGCWEIVAHHGFVERPNLPRLLASLQGRLGDWRFDPQQTTFYLPRDEVLREQAQQDVSRWRARLFAFMSYHCTSSAEYYGLAPAHVVELGVQVAL